MKTMKNKVGRNLTETWLEKSLIREGQKVDDVWMAIGQLLVKSWSAFKANEVGQKLDESWTDFEGKKVQQGYNDGTTFLKNRVCQGYANDMPEFRSHELLQPYSSITPKIASKLLQIFSNTSSEIDQERLHRNYTNPTPELKQFSLKKVSQQLPNAYPENERLGLNKSGQSRYEIGIKILRYRFGKIAVTCRWFVGEMWVAGFGKVSVRVRWFQGYKVGQFLGKTWVDLRPFYLGINTVIQPLSFIAHSLIIHNKRASYGYTKVTTTVHQECDQLLPNATRNRPLFSLFDIARVSLYVVLPDQNL